MRGDGRVSSMQKKTRSLILMIEAPRLFYFIVPRA
jgi:hypothetical protein